MRKLNMTAVSLAAMMTMANSSNNGYYSGPKHFEDFQRVPGVPGAYYQDNRTYMPKEQKPTKRPAQKCQYNFNYDDAFRDAWRYGDADCMVKLAELSKAAPEKVQKAFLEAATSPHYTASETVQLSAKTISEDQYEAIKIAIGLLKEAGFNIVSTFNQKEHRISFANRKAYITFVEEPLILSAADYR